jgi:putative endonuclease
MKQGFIYILANEKRGTIYIGVTNDLVRRIYEHKHELVDGFTKQYDCKILVYYEQADTIEVAIAREKQLKNWQRHWKINLIESLNPEWRDLYDDVCG